LSIVDEGTEPRRRCVVVADAVLFTFFIVLYVFVYSANSDFYFRVLYFNQPLNECQPLSLKMKIGPLPDVVDDLAARAFAFLLLLFVCVWNSDGE